MDQRNVGVVIIGTDHRMVWVDGHFAKLVGRPIEQLIGNTFESITHADDIDLDSKLASRLFAGKLDRYETQKRYIHRDGSVVPIHIIVTAIRDRDEKVLYAAATIESVRLLGSLHEHPSSLSAQEREMDRIRRAMLA